jgi:hypothetical protein
MVQGHSHILVVYVMIVLRNADFYDSVAHGYHTLEETDWVICLTEGVRKVDKLQVLVVSLYVKPLMKIVF